jgi:hypothetical protein
MASVRRGGEVSWRPKEPSRSSSMAAWRRERWGGGAELLLQRLPLQRPRIGGGGSGRGRRHESRRQGGAPNRGPTSPPPVLCGARSPTSPAAAWRPWHRSRMPSPARGCCSPLRRLPATTRSPTLLTAPIVSGRRLHTTSLLQVLQIANFSPSAILPLLFCIEVSTSLACEIK